MKKILFILPFLGFGLVFAQFAETPQYEFKSTSTHQYTTVQHQYTIPVAAYDLQNPETHKPRKVVMNEYNGENPGYPAADPNWTPVGDPPIIPLIIFLLCYVGYDIFNNHIKKT